MTLGRQVRRGWTKRMGMDGRRIPRRHDEAEAWWLRCMGHDALGEPLFELPAKNREALKRVDWPRRVGA